MNHHHLFIFQPGRWIGSGKISFSASPEQIRFYTSWELDNLQEGMICARQRVEMDASEEVSNRFTFYDISAEKFKLSLESELIGMINGHGIIDKTTIAWEFRGGGGIEGFEVYELQDSGDYLLHAEYSSDLFRTIIDGRIWRK